MPVSIRPIQSPQRKTSASPLPTFVANRYTASPSERTFSAASEEDSAGRAADAPKSNPDMPAASVSAAMGSMVASGVGAAVGSGVGVGATGPQAVSSRHNNNMGINLRIWGSLKNRHGNASSCLPIAMGRGTACGGGAPWTI